MGLVENFPPSSLQSTWPGLKPFIASVIIGCRVTSKSSSCVEKFVKTWSKW